MARVETIRVKLTDEQMKQLAPMFEKVDANPGAGFIVAQIWEQGYMMVGFTTPYEVKEGMESHLAKLSLGRGDTA